MTFSENKPLEKDTQNLIHELFRVNSKPSGDSILGNLGVLAFSSVYNYYFESEFSKLILESHILAFEEELKKKGNIYPYYYGSMIDRYNHVLAKKAEYFAYFNTVDTLDSNQVIENRLNIGMSPYFQGPRRFVNISNSTLLKLP